MLGCVPRPSKLATDGLQVDAKEEGPKKSVSKGGLLQRVRSSFIGKKAKPVDATDVEVMVTPSTEAEMLTKEPSSPPSQFKPPVVVEADERAKLPKKAHSEDERRASVAVQSAFRGMNARKSQYDMMTQEELSRRLSVKIESGALPISAVATLATCTPQVVNRSKFALLRAAFRIGLFSALRKDAEEEKGLASEEKDEKIKELDPEPWLGVWRQSSIETKEFEAMLKNEGVPWALRKVASAIKMEKRYEVNADGKLTCADKNPTGSWGDSVDIADGVKFELDFPTLGMKMSGETTLNDPEHPGCTVVNTKVTKAGVTKPTKTIIWIEGNTRVQWDKSEAGGYKRYFKKVSAI